MHRPLLTPADRDPSGFGPAYELSRTASTRTTRRNTARARRIITQHLRVKRREEGRLSAGTQSETADAFLDQLDRSDLIPPASRRRSPTWSTTAGCTAHTPSACNTCCGER